MTTMPSCSAFWRLLAEALAEHMHERVRKEFWGYASDENLDNEALVPRNTALSAPPGYPPARPHGKSAAVGTAQTRRNHRPNHHRVLAMLPAAAVAGWYFAHPEANIWARA